MPRKTVRCVDPAALGRFLTLNLGLVLTAVGIALFKAPNNFMFGGTSGVVTCLTRGEAIRLRRFVKEHDPKSFLTIVNSSEIIGKGFSGA